MPNSSPPQCSTRPTAVSSPPPSFRTRSRACAHADQIRHNILQLHVAQRLGIVRRHARLSPNLARLELVFFKHVNLLPHIHHLQTEIVFVQYHARIFLSVRRFHVHAQIFLRKLLRTFDQPPRQPPVRISH